MEDETKSGESTVDITEPIIINLGNGDIEFVADTADNGFHHLTLVLERAVLRKAQADFGNTDIHVQNPRTWRNDQSFSYCLI